MVTQEANVVRTSEGIRYSPSELFFRKISRHMRFKFPTKMIADINFEIDDEGRPWWIGSVVDKRIGLFGGADMIGAIMVDANTGEASMSRLRTSPLGSTEFIFPSSFSRSMTITVSTTRAS